MWMLAELLFAALTFVVQRGIAPSHIPLRNRAIWLHRTARRLLRIFPVNVQVSGSIPANGMLVCNHLGYLDILILASLTPSVFVAKNDVKSWPVFGWFAIVAGTLFVNREKRSQVRTANAGIHAALDQGALVIVFPEGTSYGGESILPFRSSLLEPASQLNHPLSIGFIRYALQDGDASEEVCYWKDMTLVPHMLNLFAKKRVDAFITFAFIHHRPPDRKTLAHDLHSALSMIHQEQTKLREPCGRQTPERRDCSQPCANIETSFNPRRESSRFNHALRD